jgi:hypothetical protein
LTSSHEVSQAGRPSASAARGTFHRAVNNISNGSGCFFGSSKVPTFGDFFAGFD